jgi:uracil-DNA glycosylase
MTTSLLGDSWYPLLKEEMEKEYFLKLKEQLITEYKNTRIYPSPQHIFKVFQLCKFEDVRCVLLLQDPYYTSGDDKVPHAHGIALSSKSKTTPYSLQIVLREVDRDVVKTKDYKEFKEAFPTNDLTPWVKQGVFLLNTVLTVRAGEVGSHGHLGWQQFTSKVLQMLWSDDKPKVFVALGSDASKALQPIIKGERRHYVLETGHPASGAHSKDRFSGINFASKINRWFKLRGLKEIEWSLRNGEEL